VWIDREGWLCVLAPDAEGTRASHLERGSRAHLASANAREGQGL
jgi:hypothetical protein